MNSTETAILFVIGLAVLLIGVGLLIYSVTQRAVHAGDEQVSGVLKAVAQLFDSIANLIGPSRAGRVGLVFVLIGLVLIFGPFLVTTRTG